MRKCINAKIADRKVSTYTMGFEEAGYDETGFARIASEHFGTDLKSYYVTPNDILAAFSKVIRYYDEPFGNSSAIPAYCCAKFAREDGATDLLAGDGGDELFAGNERYAKQFVFEHYQKVPKFLRKTLLEPFIMNDSIASLSKIIAKAKSYIEQANTPMPKRMERYSFINYFSAEKIFKEEFLQAIDQELPSKQRKTEYDRPQNASMLNRMLYMDWKFTLADNDLIKVSTACELAGIKVHYPMLDDTLIELSTKVPSDEKLKGDELRHYYKNTVKNFLPDEIINKSKHGFGLPFGEWLKKSPELQKKMYDNLDKIKNRNIFNPEFIDEIMHIHRTQQAASYYGTMVWILAVLEEWLSSRGL